MSKLSTQVGRKECVVCGRSACAHEPGYGRLRSMHRYFADWSEVLDSETRGVDQPRAGGWTPGKTVDPLRSPGNQPCAERMG